MDGKGRETKELGQRGYCFDQERRRRDGKGVVHYDGWWCVICSCLLLLFVSDFGEFEFRWCY